MHIDGENPVIICRIRYAGSTMNIDGTLILRAAHHSEAAALATMSRLHVEHGLESRWLPGRIRRHIADANSIVLVASLDGIIEGCAIMKFQDESAHLLLLVVQPKARNRGIGRALLRSLEAFCQNAGICSIRLELRASNATARHFYEALGYHAAGRVPRYYDRRESAIIMARILD